MSKAKAKPVQLPPPITALQAAEALGLSDPDAAEGVAHMVNGAIAACGALMRAAGRETADAPPPRIPASVLRELLELRELHHAARVYYERYAQDEADSLEHCLSSEQHRDAKALRDALADVRDSEIRRGAFKACQPQQDFVLVP